MAKDYVYVVSEGDSYTSNNIISVRHDLEDAKRDAFDVQCNFDGGWQLQTPNNITKNVVFYAINGCDFVKIERHLVR